MAINNNYDALTTYDRDQLIQTQRLNVTDERAGQVLAFEALRDLKGLFGEDIVAWNNMTDEAWNAEKLKIIAAAKLHPNARIDVLTPAEVEGAINLGANYFEHGYVFILNGTSPADKISFSKYG